MVDQIADASSARTPEERTPEQHAPAAGTAEPAAPAPAPSALRRRIADAAALVVLVAGFLAVNDMRAWISTPYWLDEMWVALSTRVPLTDLPHITGSTPIGWTLLLRLVPDPDALRLLPAAFGLLSVLAAYAFGRIAFRGGTAQSTLAGLACSGAVLLLPAGQVHHDLKQYTADAAVAVAFLALVAWLEAGWSRRRLVVVAAAGPVAFLVSQVTVIVAVASFGGLVIGTAARRQWRRLAETAVLGAASGLLLAVIYGAFVAPVRTPALRDWWSGFYPSVPQLPGYLHHRLQQLGPQLGFGHVAVVLLLAAAGVAVLAAQRRGMTALAVLLTPAIAVILGVTRTYPLLDQRTSYFLMVQWAVLAGIAVAGVAVGVARLVPGGPAARGRLAIACVLTLAVLGSFAATHRFWYRFDGLDPRVPMTNQPARYDVRTAVRWVDQHRHPGDVLVINDRAVFGYIFYHSGASMRWVPATNTLGWVPVAPVDPDIVVVPGRAASQIQDAVGRAVARARANGSGARVLVLRTAWSAEKDSWQAALAPYPVTYSYSGLEPVAIIAQP